VSLADLLASLALLGLVMGATLALLSQGQQLYAQGAAHVEAQQSARIALERLAREIRQAGSGGAAAAGFPAISVAERSRIVLHLDIDGDGVEAARGETVTWLLAGSVLRRNAGGGAQPIINGVRDLVLSYTDDRGAPTTVPELVRAVAIVLITEADPVSRGPARRPGTTVMTEVRLRNR
jgi:Tfp pilus assembly protein PilW